MKLSRTSNISQYLIFILFSLLLSVNAIASTAQEYADIAAQAAIDAQDYADNAKSAKTNAEKQAGADLAAAEATKALTASADATAAANISLNAWTSATTTAADSLAASTAAAQIAAQPGATQAQKDDAEQALITANQDQATADAALGPALSDMTIAKQAAESALVATQASEDADVSANPTKYMFQEKPKVSTDVEAAQNDAVAAGTQATLEAATAYSEATKAATSNYEDGEIAAGVAATAAAGAVMESSTASTVSDDYHTSLSNVSSTDCGQCASLSGCCECGPYCIKRSQ